MRAFSIALSALLALTILALPATAGPPPAKAESRPFSIGKLHAIALEDGSLQEPNDNKSFIVGQKPSEVAAVLASGGVPTDHFEFSVQPLLVKSGSRVLLFDTGAGSSFGPIAGALIKSMQAAGVDPASVTDIFISHAHGDHVGGLITSGGELAFPKAAIHMSAPEWSWLSGMSPADAEKLGITHSDRLVKAIKPKVLAFKANSELLPGLVKAVDIKGHTPGHSGYLIG